MRIGIITTLDTNIGDDLIRVGILNLLKRVYAFADPEFVCVNKHKPYTVYPAWHPAHLGAFVERLPFGRDAAKAMINNVFVHFGFSRFDSCDLIVQCGAPVFWPNCSRSEWAQPLWHAVVGRLSGKTPVLNLAAGACYPWRQRNGVNPSPEDIAYIKSTLGYCRLTTVRDRLAGILCSALGWQTPFIPCSAFLAGMGRKADLAASNCILINYMPGGGHYDWGQGIDSARWEQTVNTLISRLGRRHKLAFLCHDEKEYRFAVNFGANLPVLFPKTTEQYFDCVAGAKFAICNRMHASVGMAGLGIPSVAVGTDTRLLMVEALGLPIHYVDAVNAEMIEEETEGLLRNGEGEQERLLSLQASTWKEYYAVIGDTLSRR